ncbi:MAG: Rieske 2Fe-2S domain-containing protein [Verrucomicrobiota bacterium]
MDNNKEAMNEAGCPGGCMNRRRFLLTVAVAAACCSPASLVEAASGGERTVDAGPLQDYSSTGVYTRFRDQGFFVIRNGAKLVVLSAICTHKKCKLTAEADRTFFCDCHGSTFDPGGMVTEGPAKRDLPVLASFTNDQGHLMVKLPQG